MGEGDVDFKFLPAGGQFHLRGSDEALTPYGGLVAWDHFLQHCGVIAQPAADCRMMRRWPKLPVCLKVGSVERTPSAGFAEISKPPKWKPDLLPHYGKQEDTAIGYNL